MKTGLVLEGGGMRGIYTAGVLDAMDEAGLRAAFNGVIGVSVRSSPGSGGAASAISPAIAATGGS